MIFPAYVFDISIKLSTIMYSQPIIKYPVVNLHLCNQVYLEILQAFLIFTAYPSREKIVLISFFYS